MESLVSYILKQVAENRLSNTEAKVMLSEIQGSKKSINDDIAIIGIACKFPGADDVVAYWENLLKCENSIKPFPEERKVLPKELGLEHLYPSGGYLGEIDKFDAAFFRISPQEAKWMAPDQRLMIETAWAAVEDSGYGASKIKGTRTGVYIGHDRSNGKDYRHYCIDMNEADPMVSTGSYPSILAGRISYIMDLKGPSMVIDTACSSGLVSVHEACKAIKNNECDMAIAGGVYIRVAALKDGGLSAVESEGLFHRSFDDRTQGMIGGEGVAAVILKPVDKALEDKDYIYAVIKGSAVNNDGASSGMTAPSAETQEELFVRAWRKMKVNPENIAYIEAQGSGTKIGDTIEVTALTNAFRRFTQKRQFCALGTVKPNIGHSVSSSGLASLIKVALSLKNRKIPATINFDIPNRFIGFCESPVFINDKLREWHKSDIPQLAGVSAFGFSGTNCHMILEEAPEIVADVKVVETKLSILTFSAKHKDVLDDLVKSYVSYLDKNPEIELEDICYTANTGRGHYEYRFSVIVKEKEELKEKLIQVLNCGFKTDTDRGIYYGIHKVVATSKSSVEEGKITDLEKQKLSKETFESVNTLLGSEENYKAALQILGSNYVQGADIRWEELIYKNWQRKKVNVPGYPFKRTRHWAELSKGMFLSISSDEYEQVDTNQYNTKNSVHKLLGRCLADTICHTTYQNRLEPGDWILGDHKIIGTSIMPGTGLIEMAREACSRHFGHNNLRMEEITFLKAIYLNSNPREISTVLKKEEGYLEFIICSKQGEKWVKHVEGKAYEVAEQLEMIYELEEAKKRCIKQKDKEFLLKRNDNVEFCTRWDCIEEIFTGEEEILAKIRLPNDFIGDLREFVMHPGMMENAVNIEMRIDKANMYLPESYGTIEFYNKMPQNIYSHIKQKGLIQESGFISYDIILMDTDGKVFSKIEDYKIKKAGFSNTDTDLYYHFEWISCPNDENEKKLSQGTVLLFRDELGIAQKAAELLRSEGREVIEVDFGNGYRKIDVNNFIVGDSEDSYLKLLNEIKNRDITQVLHMMSLGKSDELAEDIQTQMITQRKSIYSIFYLIRSIVASECKGDMDILMVSDHAYEVTGDEDEIKPMNTAFLSIGKVISTEHSNLKCRCLDIDHETTADEIVNEVLLNSSQYLIARRNGKRFIEELRCLDLEARKVKEQTIRSEGIYIVTGGTGGIGLAVSERIASKSPVNLCLVNRSKFPEREMWDSILENEEKNGLAEKIKIIRGIEKSGGKVICRSADVANESQMKALFDDMREKFGRINGVIHSAGQVDGDLITNREEKDIFSVLAPKIQGTYIIGKLLSQDSPDFFVLFSSMATLIGCRNMIDYTAANAYQDSYALYGKKKGQRVIAINWPAWSETGAAITHSVKGTDNFSLFNALSTVKGSNAFEDILKMDLPRVIVGELNNNCEALHMPELLTFKLSEEINPASGDFIKGKGWNTRTELKGRDNLGEYTDIEKAIAQIWGVMFGLTEIGVEDSFFDLGGNSFIAIRLEAEIEKKYNIKCNIGWEIVDYETLEKLAAYVQRKINEQQ